MLQAPRKRLAHPPTVESLDDVDRGLEELSYLAAVANTVKADCDREIGRIKTAAERKMQTKVGGEIVPLMIRLEAIDTALREWCAANREIVLADGAKTRKFSHGMVSWTKGAMKLEFAGKKTADDVMAKIDELAGVNLLSLLLDRLECITLVAGTKITAALVCNVKLTLNRSAILQSLKTKQISADDLKALHLRVPKPQDRQNIKPAEYTVQNEAA